MWLPWGIYKYFYIYFKNVRVYIYIYEFNILNVSKPSCFSSSLGENSGNYLNSLKGTRLQKLETFQTTKYSAYFSFQIRE